jgi:hypothetical protein
VRALPRMRMRRGWGEGVILNMQMTEDYMFGRQGSNVSPVQNTKANEKILFYFFRAKVLQVFTNFEICVCQ